MSETTSCHLRPNTLTLNLQAQQNCRRRSFRIRIWQARHRAAALDDQTLSASQSCSHPCLATSLQELTTRHRATSRHIMAGKKRAAPKLGRTEKVRRQRLPDSVIADANSHARNRSRTHLPRLRHPPASSHPLNLTRCIVLCWTLRSSSRTF
jgi:hypothetical protein